MELLQNKLTTFNPQLTTKPEKEELASLVYHDIFDYPLTWEELIKWKCTRGIESTNGPKSIKSKDNFYFLEGRGGLVYKRLLRQRISARKLRIAGSAARILSIIPTIRMVAVTGALAMGNTSDESDIDLMVITKKGTLWTTRIICYLALWLYGYKTRKPQDNNQKDKLCLNMWMDEDDLVLKKRSVYAAHEIAQVVPLVNKDRIYEKFIWENRWILSYWPNSVRISNRQHVASSRQNPIRHTTYYILQLFERLAFSLQHFYMKSRITRETITRTRAFFHPVDWGRIISARLNFGK